MLYPWKKSYDQPRQQIKQLRHYFADKGPSSQSYGFSSSHVWMWELDYKESWTPKNWWFWTVVLEKTVKSPLDSKEIQPGYPKEISPECSLEGLMLKLNLQYFGHLMQRSDSLEKTLMLGKIEVRRRKGRQRMRWLDCITDLMDMSFSKLWELVKSREACCSPWGHKALDTTERLDWTELGKENCRWLMDCWGIPFWPLWKWPGGLFLDHNGLEEKDLMARYLCTKLELLCWVRIKISLWFCKVDWLQSVTFHLNLHWILLFCSLQQTRSRWGLCALASCRQSVCVLCTCMHVCHFLCGQPGKYHQLS